MKKNEIEPRVISHVVSIEIHKNKHMNKSTKLRRKEIISDKASEMRKEVVETTDDTIEHKYKEVKENIASGDEDSAKTTYNDIAYTATSDPKV